MLRRSFLSLLSCIPFFSLFGKKTRCRHDWWVYSTALDDAVILVECRKCRKRGVIHNHSQEEWDQAFSAPSHPYRWYDSHRVRIVK